MVTALLREGDGAGVEIEVPVAERRPRRDMRVPMQQNIPRLQRRELLQVIDMSVRGVDQPLAAGEDAVVREDGKLQHHLVNLRVAVAAHAQKPPACVVEHGRERLGVVPLREVVARPVIEQVAQKQQAVGPLAVERVQQQPPEVGRAVYVRCNHQLHMCILLPDHSAPSASGAGSVQSSIVATQRLMFLPSAKNFAS